MRKAKSWYGGMDSTDLDYEPIEESVEPIEESVEEPSDPDAERLVLKWNLIMYAVSCCRVDPKNMFSLSVSCLSSL